MPRALCSSCEYLPPIGCCAKCGIEICEHCRHDNLADHCDGCGCEAESAARIMLRNTIETTEQEG